MLDAMTNSNGYAEQGRRFLDQAFVELSHDDLRQASEKGWGAAAQLVKAYAVLRGLDHNSHGLLYGAVSRLVEETDDDTLRTLFNEAGGLHTNFYEGRFASRDVRQSLGQVSRFIEKVDALINGEWPQPIPAGVSSARPVIDYPERSARGRGCDGRRYLGDRS